MLQLEIREVRPTEHEALAELTIAAYQRLYDGDLGTEYARALSDIEQRVNDAVVLVAVDGDELVGGVSYTTGPGTYWLEGGEEEAGIRMLAVAPRAQGRGVGAALVAACVQRATQEGREKISLHTMESMTIAHRLYERLGFKRAPERDWPGDEVYDFRLLAYVRPL